MKKIVIAISSLLVLFDVALFATCSLGAGQPTDSADIPSSIETSTDLDSEDENSASETPGGEEMEKTYTVTYYAIENGEVVEILSELFLEDGSYPTEYNANETIRISALKELVFISANEDRIFLGWYADPDCNVYLGNSVTFKTTSDITLYAKLSVGYWTDPV